MTREGCPACTHMDAKTLDRFLSLPPGTPGGRGPRSLSRDFGLDRRDLARHQKACLTEERRAEVLRGLDEMAARHETTSTKGKN